MQSFQAYLDKFGEYGEVTEVNYPIVFAIGLPSVRLNEIVIFESGETGQVTSLNVDTVTIILFSQTRVKIGARICRTDSHLVVPVGEELLGSAINPFGIPIAKNTEIPQVNSHRAMDIIPAGIADRMKITKPMATGVALVDIMIPLGRGQKELILGDRKTGKSTFVQQTIRQQIKDGAIAIYAAIGKKKTDIKLLEEFMAQEGRNKQMIIVATGAFDSPALIYLTPFTAMTIAEYFRDRGHHVLLVLDDLLTHARFYREFSLLAQTYPGRDSYPADIFHIHAKLLERAGNFRHTEKTETSISCLPVVETQEADLTGYIVSNLMSITDGHILFDANVFAEGRRPAINIGISVTRVGKQTQKRVAKDINRELSSLFAIHDKVENLSHFGSELSESVKSIFAMGERVYSFFNQPADMILPEEIYTILFALVWLNILTKEGEIETTRDKMLSSWTQEENRHFYQNLIKTESFNDLLRRVKENKDRIMGV